MLTKQLHLSHVVGAALTLALMQNHHQLSKVVCRFLKKPQNASYGHLETTMCVHTKAWTQSFTAHVFVTVSRCKQPNWPLTSDRFNKFWYSHTMEYYSAIKMYE